MSFYRLGATPRLLSNGIRKFQQDVYCADDIILSLCHRSPHAMLYIVPPSFFFVKLLLVETTLRLGPHLAVFRRQTVIPPATLIRQRVAPTSTVVRQAAHAAVRRQTPTLASIMPIMVRHGPLLVARILCRNQTMPLRSTPLSWSAARLLSEDRRVSHALRDFPVLQLGRHLLHRPPQHPLPNLPPLLQAKVVVGTQIMLRHGLLLAARTPSRCQTMPLLPTVLNCSAARVPSEDRQVMHVLRDCPALPRRHPLHPQP